MRSGPGKATGLVLLIAMACCGRDQTHELLDPDQVDRLPALRQSIENTEVAIARRDWGGLYRMTSGRVKQRLSKPAFISNSQSVSRVTGEVTSIFVREVHLISMDDEDARGPDGLLHSALVPSHIFRLKVRLAVPSTGEYAIVIGDTTSSTKQTLWVTLIFEKVSESWALVAWHYNPCLGNGHDGYWYSDAARRFESQGEVRNAYLYRILAQQLLAPSPYAISGDTEMLSQMLSGDPPPNIPIPGVRPAETWKTADAESLEVYLVAPVAIGFALGVEVHFNSQVEDLNSEEAHQQRERVANYVKRTFPEYRDAFEGIFVGSTLPTGKAYRDYFPYDNTSQ